MNEIKSRVSYLQGLAKGLNVSAETNEGRLLSGILEVLEEIAGEIAGVKSSFEELREYVDAIDEDLAAVEEEYLGDLESDEYAEFECPSCGNVLVIEDDYDTGDDGQVKLICPKCGETVFEEDYTVDEDEAPLVSRRPHGHRLYGDEDSLPKE
ncbi:MAG: AraC family transcriptional regulator [Bacillota bacterium]|nr:AraC family transcriptional regulator [Bacillota bacterium]